MKMPFGKHKGLDVADLPLPYVQWLKGNVKLWGDLAEAIERRLSGKPQEQENDITQQVMNIVGK